MSSKHPWTYKIILEYLACKHCGYIVEHRKDYEKSEDGNAYIKEFFCGRCKKKNIFEKNTPGPPSPY